MSVHEHTHTMIEDFPFLLQDIGNGALSLVNVANGQIGARADGLMVGQCT